MKNKDDEWLNDKLVSIKKRKRLLRHVQDAPLTRKLKKDLKREQRGAKRAVNQKIKKDIKDIIDGITDDTIS